MSDELVTAELHEVREARWWHVQLPDVPADRIFAASEAEAAAEFNRRHGVTYCWHRHQIFPLEG
jgi:hypothetical protein